MNIDPHLGTLETAGLIRVAQLQPELEYLFHHALVQDAVYESLLRQDRRKLHLAVGMALERAYPDRLDLLAGRLAEHFAVAGEDQRAFEYFIRAGDHAYRQYALMEAINAYTRAIEIGARLDLSADQIRHSYLTLGRAYELRAQYDDALATYGELEHLAQKIGDQSLELAAVSSTATIYSTFTSHYDPPKGLALSERALTLARLLNDEPAQAKILWNLLLGNYSVGQPAQAMEYGAQSLEIARRLNLREQLAYTLHDYSNIVGVVTSDISGALALKEEALAIWRELGNRAMLADGLSSIGTPLTNLGRYQEAIDNLEEALRITEEIDNLWGQSYARMGLSFSYVIMGDSAAAIEAARQSIALCERAGFGFPLVFCRCVIAMIDGYLGCFDLADGELAAAKQAVDDVLPMIAPMLQVFEIVVRAEQGDFDRVEALLETLGNAQAWDDPTADIELCIARAMAHLNKGRPDEAIRTVDALIGKMPPEIHRTLFVCEARRVKASAMRVQGDLAGARLELESVLRDLDETGAHFYVWEAVAELARVAEEVGNSAEAAALRARTRDEIHYLIERICDPALEASFRARPDVSALLEEGHIV